MANEILCLFVGGPYDGRYFEVDCNLGRFRFPVRKAGSPYHHPNAVESTIVETVTYVRQEWRTSDRRRYVFYHDAIKPEDVLDTLLRGYRRGP